MTNTSIEAEISFRFNRLDKLQAFTIVREIVGASYNEGQKDNCYVAYTTLTDNNIDDINDFYVRQQVALDDVDICISVNATSGTNTINVPIVVNKMLKYIDCKLTFSFAVI